MKKNILSFLALLSISLGTLAADGSKISIKNLFCTSALNHPAGVTTVTYTGISALDGEGYVNVSNKPFFGFPFTQQARVSKINVVDDVLTLTLKTMVTKETLLLVMNSSNGDIYLKHLKGQAAIAMTCQADFNG